MKGTESKLVNDLYVAISEYLYSKEYKTEPESNLLEWLHINNGIVCNLEYDNLVEMLQYKLLITEEISLQDAAEGLLVIL